LRFFNPLGIVRVENSTHICSFYYLKRYGSHPCDAGERSYRRKLNVQRNLAVAKVCAIIITPTICKRKERVLASPGIMRAVVLRSIKGDTRDQACICHARADTFLDTLQTQVVSGDDGREL